MTFKSGYMKVRIVERPTGYLSVAGGGLQPWPERGEVIDLPDALAEGMLAAGHVERVQPQPPLKVETRPAVVEDVEARPAATAPKKAPAKAPTRRKG